MEKLLKSTLCFLFFAYVMGCKPEQIADDSPCPNCPVVTNVTPEIAQEGNDVTITGQRFGNDKAKITVEIQTTPQKVALAATDISSVTDTEIKFKVPTGKQGAGKVVVKLNVGTDILASDDAGISPKPTDIIFTFKGKASITNATSLTGRVGETVSVTGINFGTKKEDIKIKIAAFDVPASNITSVTDTEIKFTIPPKVPETGAVSVTILGFAVGGSLAFQYKVPKITTTALTGTKDVVIDIAGDNFGTTAADVKVAVGTTDVPVQSVTNTLVKVKIPKGLVNGKATVKVLDYEAKEKPEFLYKWTATVSTLIANPSPTGGTWTFDANDDAIYYVTTAISGTNRTLSAKKLNVSIKPAALTDVINNLTIFQNTSNSSLITPMIIVAYDGLLLMPYKEAGKNMMAQFFVNSTKVNISTTQKYSFNVNSMSIARVPLPATLESVTVNSIGILNRLNIYLGTSTPQVYETTTSSAAWESPYSKAIALPTNISSTGISLSNGEKLYIPIEGGIVMGIYDANNQITSTSILVGSTTAKPYTNPNAQGDGHAIMAWFNKPYAITKGAGDTFFISDTGNSLIRMVTKNTDGQYVVSTIAGMVGSPGNMDGTISKFQTPKAIYYSSKNNTIYVADQDNKSLRSITLD